MKGSGDQNHWPDVSVDELMTSVCRYCQYGLVQLVQSESGRRMECDHACRTNTLCLHDSGLPPPMPMSWGGDKAPAPEWKQERSVRWRLPWGPMEGLKGWCPAVVGPVVRPKFPVLDACGAEVRRICANGRNGGTS